MADSWLRKSLSTSDLLTLKVQSTLKVLATVMLQAAAGMGEICCYLVGTEEAKG